MLSSEEKALFKEKLAFVRDMLNGLLSSYSTESAFEHDLKYKLMLEVDKVAEAMSWE